MEILLIENFPSLGYVGDTVQVKSGYARNYLIPRGLAVEVGSRRAKVVQHLQQGVLAKRNKLKGEAEEFGEKLSKEKLDFTLKMGSQGKSFGSISNRDILKQLIEKGYELDRKQIRLSEPIKAPGSYKVTVQLHTDVSVEVPVEVEGIKEKPKADAEDKKRGRKRKAADNDDAGEESVLEEGDIPSASFDDGEDDSDEEDTSADTGEESTEADAS